MRALPTPLRGATSPARQRAALGLLALMALVVAIQLVPYGHEHTNPPVLAEPAWRGAETRALFFRACADCHSNETAWPWYSDVAPTSWLIVRDVREGRAAFNVSAWGRPENTGEDAAETVSEGSMPPWFYTSLHPAAALTPAERQALIDGLVATFGGAGAGDDER